MDAGRENFPEHSPGWRRVLESLLHTFAKIPCEVKLGRFRHLLKLIVCSERARVSRHRPSDACYLRRRLECREFTNHEHLCTSAAPLGNYQIWRVGRGAPRDFFSHVACPDFSENFETRVSDTGRVLPALQPRAVARFRAC